MQRERTDRSFVRTDLLVRVRACEDLAVRRERGVEQVRVVVVEQEAHDVGARSINARC